MIDRVFDESTITKIDNSLNKANKIAKKNPNKALGVLKQANINEHVDKSPHFKGAKFNFDVDAKVNHIKLNHLTSKDINTLGLDMRDQKMQNDESFADFTKLGDMSYPQRINSLRTDLSQLKGFKDSVQNQEADSLSINNKAKHINNNPCKYLDDHPRLKTCLNLKVNHMPHKDYIHPESKKPVIEDSTTGDCKHNFSLQDYIEQAETQIPKTIQKLQIKVVAREQGAEIAKKLDMNQKLSNQLHVATGNELMRMKNANMPVRVVQTNDPDEIGWKTNIQPHVLYRRDSDKELGDVFGGDGAVDMQGRTMVRPLTAKEIMKLQMSMNRSIDSTHSSVHHFKKMPTTTQRDNNKSNLRNIRHINRLPNKKVNKIKELKQRGPQR